MWLSSLRPLFLFSSAHVRGRIAMELWYEDNRQKQRMLKSDSLWKWEKELVFNKEGYTEYVLDDTLIVASDMYYYRG